MKAPVKQNIVGKTVVIFDSDCVLCSRFVRFLIKYDRKETLLFTDPKSTYFDFLFKTHQVTPPLETVYAIYNGKILQKSEAVIRIVGQISWWGKLISILKLIPKSWRDRCYDWIANNRYQWFGKTNTCVLEDLPEKRKRRFID